VLGEDTVAVLQSYGIADGEIESLLARRVVVQGTAQRTK